MKKQNTTAWVGGLAAAAAAFLFWKSKGRATAALAAPALRLRVPTPELPATDGRSATPGLRVPTPENGHVRDVVATDLPAGGTGSNFSVHNDVHQPSSTESNS